MYNLSIISGFKVLIEELFCQFVSESSEIDVTEPILQLALLVFHLFDGNLLFLEDDVD
jgi:hypothetical protein